MNEVLCRLLGERMGPFLEKWGKCPEVVSFCSWLRDQEHPESTPLSLDSPGDVTEFLRRFLENKEEQFFWDCLEFLYDENVRSFAREFPEEAAPTVEVDLVTILKMVQMTRFSEALQRQMEKLIREEFGYMVDRFVTTWDKHAPEQDLISVCKMPLKSIIEYDLTEESLREIPQATYWP